MEPMALIRSYRAKGWGCNFPVGHIRDFESEHVHKGTTNKGGFLNKAELNSCNISGVRLNTCHATNCQFKNCSLFNCFVTGDSTLQNCQIVNCTILFGPNLSKSKFEKGVLSGVEVDKGEVRGSFCFDSKFSECIVRTCKLDGVEVDESKVYLSMARFCAIDKAGGASRISTTDIDDCEQFSTATSVLNCEATTTALALRKFPPEIREVILYWALRNECSIIPALRGEPKLYHEMLNILYQKFIYDVSEQDFSFETRYWSETQNKWLCASAPAWKRFIKCIELDADLLPINSHPFRNLRCIYINFDEDQINDFAKADNLVTFIGTELGKGIHQLKEFKVVVACPLLEATATERGNEVGDYLITSLNDMFGFQGYLFDVLPSDYVETWFWNAGMGRAAE